MIRPWLSYSSFYQTSLIKLLFWSFFKKSEKLRHWLKICTKSRLRGLVTWRFLLPKMLPSRLHYQLIKWFDWYGMSTIRVHSHILLTRNLQESSPRGNFQQGECRETGIFQFFDREQLSPKWKDTEDLSWRIELTRIQKPGLKENTESLLLRNWRGLSKRFRKGQSLILTICGSVQISFQSQYDSTLESFE